VQKSSILILLLALLFNAQNSSSEEPIKKNKLESKFGLYFGYQLNSHLVGFDSLTSINTCCTKYTDGSGGGVYLGILYEFELPNNLSTGFRIGASTLSGELTGLDSSEVIVNDNLQQGVSKHILKNDLFDFGIEPYITYNSDFGFDFTIGGRLGAYVINRYAYVERLVEPENRGVFADNGRRDRNEEAADWQETTIYGGILGRIDYDFILTEDSSFTIAPEVSYYLGMTDVIERHDWKINSMKFGISINYLPKEKPKEWLTENRSVFNIDTLTIESEEVTEDRFALGLPDEKNTIDTTVTKILKVKSITRTDTLFTRPAPIAKVTSSSREISINVQFLTESFPVIPVVFFDKNSSELPPIYRNSASAADFILTNIDANAIDLHQHTLDIVGQRMVQNENTTISIRGYADKDTEYSNCDLAMARARSLKKYLLDVWEIDAKRINIKQNTSNCSPRRTAETPGEDSFAENRRADISTKSFDLIAPVIRKQLLEINSYHPNYITFSTEGSTQNGVKKWDILGNYQGQDIVREEYTSNLSNLKLVVNKALINELKEESPLHLRLTVTDAMKHKASASESIQVKIDTSNYELSRLAMINFDIASDRISKTDKLFFGEFIKDINDSSVVRIIGFSDIIGGEKFNQKLSEKRAKNVAKLLNSIKPNAQIREIKGVGSSEFSPGVESFATPIERYLSRTVYIEILNKLD
jgi:outer membrane protein OmpA-like peptidoglycan-associated protein